MREEKQSEIIHESLNYLDDEMIEEVAKFREDTMKDENEHSSMNEKHNFLVRSTPTNKMFWQKWTALAASICVLIAGGWIYASYLHPVQNLEEILEAEHENNVENENQNQDMEESLKQQGSMSELDEVETPVGNCQDLATAESLRTGVTIPKMEVSLKIADNNVEEDMLGFFILNDRSYIQYEFQHDYVQTDADFVGEYVGHITGLLNEWTEADGYVDGAGTYTGDVYEVKGVSPEFMLCMVWEDGSVETFIHHNDITLYKGSDLVDDWLDLRGNVDAISVETIKNNQFAHKKIDLTEEEMTTFDEFLNVFAEGEFVYVEEKLEHPYGGDNDTADMTDFYFVKENGVRLRFRTLGDGYVSFPWIDACVKIDQEIYDEVVEILLRYGE